MPAVRVRIRSATLAAYTRNSGNRRGLNATISGSWSTRWRASAISSLHGPRAGSWTSGSPSCPRSSRARALIAAPSSVDSPVSTSSINLCRTKPRSRPPRTARSLPANGARSWSACTPTNTSSVSSWGIAGSSWRLGWCQRIRRSAAAIAAASFCHAARSWTFTAMPAPWDGDPLKRAMSREGSASRLGLRRLNQSLSMRSVWRGRRRRSRARVNATYQRRTRSRRNSSDSSW